MSTFAKVISKLLPYKPVLKVGTKNEACRVSWIEHTLKKIPKGSRILDAGAGEQQFRKFCQHLNYVSQDIAEYDGKGAVGLHTGEWEYGKLDIVSDIIAIPEADTSFDAIMCTEVLEHVPDPAKVLEEFNRLLKPGGYLIITAPFCSLTHFAPYHYSTGFNHYFYEKHLKDYDFDIIEIEANGNYFEYVAQEIRRLPRIAASYAGGKLSPLEERSQNIMLQMLDRLSTNDEKSNELLCFGYHVFAKKR